MVKNLVIVESPAKAKTIEGYLGQDFVVRSSYGHVRDLPKDNNAIDIANGFKPTYVVSADKRELIAQLKKLSKEAETVWLASDDDREGEAISWHLAETLNLPAAKTRRIVFREITKNAILAAIAAPRTVNQDLVNAQQARRVLDRLVGFELSPIRHFFLFSGHKELWGSSLCHSLVPYTVGDLLLCYLKEAVTNI